jgi:hypothetical protein
MSVDDQGNVWTAMAPGGPSRELVITATPRVGDRIGERVVAAVERLKTPFGAVPALRIETFAPADPSLTEEKRSEWQGRYFAAGIGQVGEADGLGGECLLIRYLPRKARR